MQPIILIAMLYLLSHLFFINGQEIELSFNTPVYEGTNDYYAHIGDDVMLTCTVRSEQAQVYMERGSYYRGSYELLVENGELVGDLENQNDKYSFHSNNGQYKLTIHSLKETDSLPYRCGFCTKRCQVCTWCRFCMNSCPFCTRPCQFCTQPCRPCTEPCESCRLQCRKQNEVVVPLEVKEPYADSLIPDFCDLINNTDGIFFTGSNLTLRCPKLSMNITASNRNYEFSVDFDTEYYSDTFSLLTVKSLSPKFNGTMLSCTDMNVQNGDVSNDYCRYFPTILVFNEITFLLLGGERGITNGENVTFTCHTYPFLRMAIQWDMLDNKVSFEEMSISEIDQGSNITFTDLQFLDPSSSRLTVFCNVTIGSKSSSEMSWIYPSMQFVTSSAQTTSFFSEISSTQVTLSETMSAAGSDMPSFSPVSIVAPVIVVIGIIAIIVLGIVYIKLRKPVSSNKTDHRNGNVNQNTVHVENIVYNIGNTEGTELGLTHHDSEVADNVAYVSYDENYKRG